MTDPVTPTAQPRERVLFVDDEPRVLDGLRRMLRSMRDVWDMQFVGSGKEALDIVVNEGVTVLITDMQMPDMSGDKLLEAVCKVSPATVRIVLSGQSDAEHLYRSMNKAHQYLTKPCSSEVLSRVIEQACTLRNLVSDDALRRTVSSMKTVPSPPEIYRRLLVELEDPDCSLQTVGNIIAEDIGMTASVLRFINSAWFALNRPIENTAEAVLMLGIDAIKTLVLSSHVFNELEAADHSKLIHEIGEHSVQVAQFSKRIAGAEDADAACASHAFTAGMMHEVGLMVLAVNEPKVVSDAFRLAFAEKITMLEAERRLFKATHAQIGAYLLGLWGLPNPIIEAVAFLGNPRASVQSTFSPLCAVHVAESHVHASSRVRVRAPELDTVYLSRIGLRSRLPVWQELATRSPTGKLLGVQGGLRLDG